ncbi:hypothetical protein Hanom_Chr03g00213551 [Helianthus anomalus]
MLHFLSLWQLISTWCRVLAIYTFSINDLFQLHTFSQVSATCKSLINLVIILACWVIWKKRNKVIFSNGALTR